MPVRRLPRSLPRLLVYALANAGGVIGFLPLLTLLLPIKVEAVAAADRIAIVTACTLAGAVAASLSNILFGWWSDRAVAAGGGRRRFVAAGLAATAASYAAIAAAATPIAIVVAVVAFQVAINAVLAPFLAIMADEIADADKGLAGGLLALANPLASAVTAAALGIAALGEGGRLALVVAATVACILPLLLIRPSSRTPVPAVASAPAAVLRRDLLVAWVARLLVQAAGGVLFYYLLYVFEGAAPGEAPAALAARVGHLMTLAYALPLPVAVLIGRWSDRSGRRKPFLAAAAALAAAGLAAMALVGGWSAAAWGFAAYALGSSVFLALHATFVMQLLPDPPRRGRDLGLVNLSNTLPALIGPAMTWALAGPRDFAMLLGVLAVLTACGGVTMLAVRARA